MLFITVSKTLKIAMFKSQERQHRKEIQTHFRARYMAINHLLLGIHGKDTGCVHEKGLQKTDGPKGIMELLTAI